MVRQHARSMGVHIGRQEVTVSDPVTGRTLHREVAGDGAPAGFREALEAIYRELGKPANHMQVAFSDDLLLFAAWPLPEAPRKRGELDRLAKWRLSRITPDLDDWEIGSQVVGGEHGAMLLVCAVRRSLMEGVREFVRHKPLRWTVADSCASFVFNGMKRELRNGPGALLVHSESHWTFMSWDSAGTVNLVKPGTVAGDDESATDVAGEVIRLLHAAEGQGGPPPRVMVWGFSQALGELAGGEDLPFEPVRDLLPSADGRATRFGHLMAQLASYGR